MSITKEVIVLYTDDGTGNSIGEIAGEVVRCKECIHSGQCTKEIVMKMWVGSYLYCPMGDEGFCSHGERKEDA